jgi:hypothetical protein
MKIFDGMKESARMESAFSQYSAGVGIQKQRLFAPDGDLDRGGGVGLPRDAHWRTGLHSVRFFEQRF